MFLYPILSFSLLFSFFFLLHISTFSISLYFISLLTFLNIFQLKFLFPVSPFLSLFFFHFSFHFIHSSLTLLIRLKFLLLFIIYYRFSFFFYFLFFHFFQFFQFFHFRSVSFSLNVTQITSQGCPILWPIL